MVIVFDMDNTLVDEFGSMTRPGAVELLERLRREGHTLVLWTNSRGARARQIIMDHGLRRYFGTFIFREDYDPGEKGLRKDIRKVKGDVLVDDDPGEIAFVKTIGKKGVIVQSYRKGMSIPPGETEEIYRNIRK